MSVTALGAPGIRFATTVAPVPLHGVHRDVAAFAGVSPRGPARLPVTPPAADEDLMAFLGGAPRQRSVAVPVDSWQDYRATFGGFEGAGRLPYAVSAFFAQGGRRAHVVRIVHDYADPAQDLAGCATGWLGRPASAVAAAAPLLTTAGQPVTVQARNEGTWGNRLRGGLSWRFRPVPMAVATVGTLTVPVQEWLPVGTLLRLTLAGGAQALQFVDGSERVLRPDRSGADRVLTFDAPLAAAPVVAEAVTADLTVVDDDPLLRRREQLLELGLRADHPRWLARVLITESALVWPAIEWAGATIALPDPGLPALTLLGDGGAAPQLRGGGDRSAQIVPADFFDLTWLPGDELPGSGIQCLAEVDEVGLLLAPDVYAPSSLVPVEAPADPPTLAGPAFAACVEPVLPPPPVPVMPELAGLRLDPAVPADLAAITAAQTDLIGFAVQRGDLVVLLDVPPGLGLQRTLAWRGSLGMVGSDSAFAASYHPWLDVSRPDDDREGLISINPSAFAAGIIAARELRDGVHVGPANVLAAGAVRLGEAVSPDAADRLHPVGINVFRTERDGIRLTAARTLSRDLDLRQLSVVRLLTSIRLALQQQLAWLVFEPNGEPTWRAVRRAVGTYLDSLHRVGALAGATPGQSYFVRCGRDTMTNTDLDNGRLIAEIGVAPSQPLEYLVLQLSVESEVLVQLEGSHG
ncbi:phage tail sheath subtilisin-like domain-containing protein [Kribbella sp. NPDC051952]|uniref:phage tail sheath subtilisin-like domain-containing protein n=1 Tax=Kribbella sp. NPDC051952 TaxID=3154851 RepID=UPI003437854F